MSYLQIQLERAADLVIRTHLVSILLQMLPSFQNSEDPAQLLDQIVDRSLAICRGEYWVSY